MDVRRALALALVVPLLLAGCSEDEPEPKMPDSSPTSSEPSPSPTETETAEAESAEDFIRRWQAAALSAQSKGVTTEYRALGPKCRPCNEFADQVDAIYADGGTIELDKLDVLSVEPVGASPDQFTLTRVLGATRVLNDSGAEEQSFPGGREVLTVVVEEVRGDWRVRNFLRTSA